MKKSFLRAIPLAVTAALMCIYAGCGDDGVQNKNAEVGEFVTMFAGGGARYTLSVNVTPTGGGTVSRKPDTTSYKAGSKVTVTAIAAIGYRFAGWTGAMTDPTDSVTVTMSRDLTLTANFVDIYSTPYTIAVNSEPNNGGSVSRDPNKVTYTYGDSVTVTAMPADGYAFTGWLGASGSNDPTIKIMIDNHKTLTANFKDITFTDSRDGQRYKTVKIGNQMWMAQNMNYQTSSGSWCYNDNSSYCDNYGRLYDWNTAKTACPTGWHLPYSQEWSDLATVAGGSWVAGSNLKSTTGWSNGGNGSDIYGFSALSGGGRDYNDGSFVNAGNSGYWWTVTETGSATAYYRGMDYNGDYVGNNAGNKSYGFSVRCVAD